MNTFTLFVMGPAGSGKSSFVASFAGWLENNEIPYLTVNLDPAAEYVPYTPDVDIRAYVTAKQVMDEYMLGPNGAIIAAVDLTLNFIPGIQEEVAESISEGYILVDTPGQMEIFAFRRSGVEVVKELTIGQGGVAFIVDAALSKSPPTFVSQIFLASSVYYRFRMPQLNLFNKVDLLSEKELEEMVNWVREPTSLINGLEKELIGEEMIMVRGLLESVKSFLESFSIYFVSTKISKGLDSVYADLQKIYKGGEDYEIPDYMRKSE
ncbi:MAG: ATP/GTP-binding protein [Thermofilaceae archaeon]|nr:ATP/GTP-binding protein [Thermofilaceae archaeon]MCX8181205.1 ATP/GTP-binding protein [Thermofilaceae archaeon]MDW8004492.1 ATP/GTP-binding protein [Thermofilaceae archaeon]